MERAGILRLAWLRRREPPAQNLHVLRLAGLDGPYRLSPDGWEPEPRFGFAQLADAVAKAILESSPRLTLGIYGNWGAGKTTLLRAVDTRIRHDRCVVVWFDMWEHKSETAVVPFLLHEIAAALPSGSRAARRMQMLGRAALASAKVNAGQISFSGSDFLNELDKLWEGPRLARDTLEESVRSWRVESEQRIVVIVDNLDRCLPKQAVNLLEQTTSLFDFEGVVFVLAAQKEWLAAAVEAEYELAAGEGATYLEKIVQVEFHVPGFDETGVVQWIQQALTDENLRLSDEEARLLAETADWNPRRIKRLLNNVRMQLSTMRTEFAGDTQLALASALLLHCDREEWLHLTGSHEARAEAEERLREAGRDQG